MIRTATVCSLVLLSACGGPGMHSLRAPPAELSDPIDPACEPVDLKADKVDVPDGVDCKDQKRRMQTWRLQQGIFGDDVKLVLTGDTGVRAAIGKDVAPREVGRGPLGVSAAAEAACAGTCTGAVFLGDNLYQSGVNFPDDTAFLRSFAKSWSWAGPQWYVQGNHDWGAFPRLMPWEGKHPQRDRAQRLFRDVRSISAEGDVKMYGDAHFWGTSIGQGRLVALDTNYLVRRCDETKGGIRCKGDPGKDKADRIRIGSLVERTVAGAFGPVIVVGHHPWLSNGEHGQAGDFKDSGMALWKGKALRRVLDDVVAPNAALYVSGHDHNTQVARVDDGTLAIVVGAGGKTTAAGKDTAQGEDRHVAQVEHQVYCQLGFVTVQVEASKVVAEVHTVPHPNDMDPVLLECREELAERRPDLATPDGPTCRRWTWDGSSWDAGTECGEAE